MKTNQIFNFRRFTNYATSSFVLRYRSFLLQLGVASAGVFLVALVALSQNGHNWSYQDWAEFIFFVIPIAGILYVGSAFPNLRTRNKAQTFLMVPASNSEKFVYEIFERFILFLIVFPVVVYVFGNLAVSIVNETNQVRWGGGSATSLSYYKIFTEKWTDQRAAMVFVGAFALLSLAFAGAVSFRKNPLIKTVVFVGAVIAVIAAYSFVVFEKMRLNSPWIDGITWAVPDDRKEYIFIVVVLAACALTLAFAFFKLKEKEAV